MQPNKSVSAESLRDKVMQFINKHSAIRNRPKQQEEKQQTFNKHETFRLEFTAGDIRRMKLIFPCDLLGADPRPQHVGCVLVEVTKIKTKKTYAIPLSQKDKLSIHKDLKSLAELQPLKWIYATPFLRAQNENLDWDIVRSDEHYNDSKSDGGIDTLESYQIIHQALIRDIKKTVGKITTEKQVIRQINIIDAGCGAEPLLPKIMQELAGQFPTIVFKGLGFDISPLNITSCQSNFSHPSIQYCVADITHITEIVSKNIDQNENSVTLLVCSGILNRVVLRGAYQCLTVLQNITMTNIEYVFATGFSAPLFTLGMIKRVGFIVDDLVVATVNPKVVLHKKTTIQQLDYYTKRLKKDSTLLDLSMSVHPEKMLSKFFKKARGNIIHIDLSFCAIGDYDLLSRALLKFPNLSKITFLHHDLVACKNLIKKIPGSDKLSVVVRCVNNEALLAGSSKFISRIAALVEVPHILEDRRTKLLMYFNQFRGIVENDKTKMPIQQLLLQEDVAGLTSEVGRDVSQFDVVYIGVKILALEFARQGKLRHLQDISSIIVNSRDALFMDCLIEVAAHGCVEDLEFLFKQYGASSEQVTECLFMAVLNDNKKIFEFLKGHPQLTRSKIEEFVGVSLKSEKIKIIKILGEVSGVFPKITDFERPLNTNSIRKLLNAGCKLPVDDLLACAVSEQNNELAKILQEEKQCRLHAVVKIMPLNGSMGEILSSSLSKLLALACAETNGAKKEVIELAVGNRLAPAP